jgi:hypothetical protein
MAIAANYSDGLPKIRLIFIAYCNLGKTWRIIRIELSASRFLEWSEDEMAENKNAPNYEMR